MTRARVLLTIAVVALITVAWWTFSSYSQQTASDRILARPLPGPVLQPDHAVDLVFALGLKDEEQVAWTGTVTVTSGRVLGIEIIQAAGNASVEGAAFSVRAARRARPQNQEQGPLLPARLRVRLDAPSSSTVTLNTSRGNSSFALAELALQQPRTLLDGDASVERQEAATCLTGKATEDDFPVLANAPDGTVWLAYAEYKPGPPLVTERVLSGQFDALVPNGHGDQIKLVRFDGRTWHPPLNVTAAGLDIWRPTITVDGRGSVWIAWAEKIDGDWEIMSRRFSPIDAAGGGNWSEVMRVTNAAGSDFHTVAATDSSGRVWLAWQGWRKDNYEILASSFDGDRWTNPETISRSERNDWSPTIATDSKQNVYIAWDTYDRDNYDVQLIRLSEGKLAQRQSVADSPRFEARPNLICDKADRLWIAYEEGDEQWGKDYLSENNYQKVGFAKNPGFALYVNRTVRVKCLVDESWKRPAADVESAFEGTLARNKSVPRLAMDGQEGIWLFVRHHPLAGGGGETWDSYALRYDGRTWSKPRHLTHSANLLDNRPALAAHNRDLLVVYSGDYRTRSQNRQQDDLFSAILAGEQAAVPPRLAEDRVAAEAELLAVHPREAEDVSRLRSYRVSYQGKALHPLRGEFHRHTEYTSHRDQDGLLEDAWRYALDAGHLDWMGDGDHDNGFGHEYLWWQIQKISDLHHNPPHFVAAMTYERSLQFPNGHRNVMMPRRGIRPLPRGSLESSPEEGTADTKILYSYLKHFGGICASHTSGTNMGTDWRDNDPDVEPIVEIYQGHRHNYEHFGAPRSATAQTQIGGYQPAGFVWNALERGHRLGFQSSSDHVSTHMSYAIVLAEDASRQAIIDAFKQRHCYAATDNILLVIRSGNHLMGDAFETNERPKLTVEVHGTAPVAKLHVIRDNKYVYIAEPNEREVQLTFTDVDAQAGKTSYYYVRVDQDDGNLAWGSPMWITYRP